MDNKWIGSGRGIEQNFSFLAVVGLPESQAQCNGTTVSVNEDMDFARRAAMVNAGLDVNGAAVIEDPQGNVVSHGVDFWRFRSFGRRIRL